MLRDLLRGEGIAMGAALGHGDDAMGGDRAAEPSLGDRYHLYTNGTWFHGVASSLGQRSPDC